jgi:hypothetical protein
MIDIINKECIINFKKIDFHTSGRRSWGKYCSGDGSGYGSQFGSGRGDGYGSGINQTLRTGCGYNYGRKGIGDGSGEGSFIWGY